MNTNIITSIRACAPGEAALQLTILGSGTSSGVPTVGCTCPTCTSSDPKDRRTRPSIWIATKNASVIIDTSSDFRAQCLLHNVSQLDGIVYTHHHFDHIAGFDDLRAFNYTSRKPVRIYLMAETLTHLRHIFDYAFAPDGANPSSTPSVDATVITDEPFVISDIQFTPVPLLHGDMRVNGYRFGNAAYCTDCNQIPPSSIPLLANLDVLILDALRLTPHPTHFTVQEAVDMALRIGARQTYLTHIAHDILHAEVDKALPDNIHLGHDGLTLRCGEGARTIQTGHGGGHDL